MPHIHTEPGQHDHTNSIYIVRTDGDEPLVWLHMHRKLHRLLAAGGHIELDETPWQSIAHELTEESGYTLSDLELLQPEDRIKSFTDNVILHPQPVVVCTQNPVAGHYHIDSAYAFITDQEPSLAIGATESHDIRWLSRAELDNLDVETEVFANTQKVYQYILDVCLPKWDRVSSQSFEL
ncbi:MAG: NUDIX domain-containing protein [bacterium]